MFHFPWNISIIFFGRYRLKKFISTKKINEQIINRVCEIFKCEWLGASLALWEKFMRINLKTFETFHYVLTNSMKKCNMDNIKSEWISS